MTEVRRGTLLSFDSSAWTALVLLEGADVESQMAVGQWVPPDTMVAGVEVAALVFGDTNTDDGLVVGSYGAAFGPTVQLTSSGTWTPSFKGSGTAGTFTYSAQTGVYTQIGKLVYVSFRVAITAITVAPTGTMTIEGLPFTAEAGIFHAISFSSVTHFNYTNTAFEMSGRIGPSDANIDLLEFFDSAANVAVPAANFTDTACDLSGSGIYRVP